MSTKLEVSAALLFRENRNHGTDRQTEGRTARQRNGQTDGRGATLNAASREGGLHTKLQLYQFSALTQS